MSKLPYEKEEILNESQGGSRMVILHETDPIPPEFRELRKEKKTELPKAQ